jgi:sortase B
MNTKKALAIKIITAVILLAAITFAIIYSLKQNQTEETSLVVPVIVRADYEPEVTEPPPPPKRPFDVFNTGLKAKAKEAYDTKNQDVVGWIQIDGTPIDYPILQSQDDEFYLHNNINKAPSSAGAIFADYRCVWTPTDDYESSLITDHIVLYGHNMKNGTMFAGLKKYFYNNEFVNTHRIINVSSKDVDCKYKIFAYFESDGTANADFKYWNYYDFTSKEEFDYFVNYCKEHSIVKMDDVSLEYGDKLLTLQTCKSGTDFRRIVIAKRIYTEEEVG